jgi:GNAT superfamily N-acetyltransferase
MRFARAGERRALEALQRRASLIWDDQRAALLAHPDAIEVPIAQLRGRCVRLAEAGGELIGFAAIVPLRPQVLDLDALFVEPRHMRKGIGQLLIEDAARLARRRGARAIEVIANPNALRFYQRVGFEQLGLAGTRFGPGLKMRLEIRR